MEVGQSESSPPKLINEFLLAKDDRKMTAWHVAAERGNWQALEKMWEWAKEKLTTEELNTKLLLAKDNRERTAFHAAAMIFNTVIRENMEVGQSEFNPTKINK
jgi:ankyrin repeat protein